MPFLPMMLGAAGAAVAMLLDAWGRRAASVACSTAGLLAGAAVAGWSVTVAPVEGIAGAGGVFGAVAAGCLALGALVLAGSFRTLSGSAEGPRTASLIALAAGASALLAVSLDLGLLFLAVEALALCGYGLVALADTDRAREAAMKWFVQGSIATAMLIIGIAVIISRTDGLLSFAAVRTAALAPQASVPLATGLILVLSALAFKAGAFPFHSWMPDAFETAPPAASAVLASAGKIGPIAAAVWLASSAVGATGDRMLGVIALVSVASIVFGNLAALRQRSLARMLAYSAIAQVGYALSALPLVQGRASVLVFAALYALASAGAFLFIVALRSVEPGWDGSIAGLAGLSARRPALAVSLVPVMLSLTGIPLTAGFWGKFLVFGAAATGGYLWLAIVAVIGSVVSFGYYGGVLRSAFLDEAPPAGSASLAGAGGGRSIGSAGVATVVVAVMIVVVGVLPLVTGLGLLGPLR